MMTIKYAFPIPINLCREYDWFAEPRSWTLVSSTNSTFLLDWIIIHLANNTPFTFLRFPASIWFPFHLATIQQSIESHRILRSFFLLLDPKLTRGTRSILFIYFFAAIQWSVWSPIGQFQCMWLSRWIGGWKGNKFLDKSLTMSDLQFKICFCHSQINWANSLSIPFLSDSVARQRYANNEIQMWWWFVYNFPLLNITFTINLIFLFCESTGNSSRIWDKLVLLVVLLI